MTLRMFNRFFVAVVHIQPEIHETFEKMKENMNISRQINARIAQKIVTPCFMVYTLTTVCSAENLHSILERLK